MTLNDIHVLVAARGYNLGEQPIPVILCLDGVPVELEVDGVGPHPRTGQQCVQLVLRQP